VSGLLNRLGLIDQISRRMLTDGQSVRWSVFVLDLDYFHHIVESLGYEFGNQLLKKTGEMLSSYFEQAVAIARLHADVFAVCLKDTHLGPHDVALRSSKPVGGWTIDSYQYDGRRGQYRQRERCDCTGITLATG
jgi:GGDEF domain-containing protein